MLGWLIPHFLFADVGFCSLLAPGIVHYGLLPYSSVIYAS
jgi:hypothetical protein